MPTVRPRTVSCSQCSFSLPVDQLAACPKCGCEAKLFRLSIIESVSVRDKLSGTLKQLTEYVSKHPVLFPLTIMGAALSVFIGGWIGGGAGTAYAALITIVCFVLGPRASQTVKSTVEKPILQNNNSSQLEGDTQDRKDT